MTSVQYPSAGDILDGLCQDPSYQLNSDNFNRVKDYVILLPEVATANGLAPDQPLDLFALLTLQSAFMRTAIARGMDMGLLGASAALSALDMQDEMIPGVRAQVEDGTLNPHDIMLSERAGLNAQLQELYRAGTLAIGTAIKLKPTVFMTK